MVPARGLCTAEVGSLHRFGQPALDGVRLAATCLETPIPTTAVVQVYPAQ